MVGEIVLGKKERGYFPPLSLKVKLFQKLFFVTLVTPQHPLDPYGIRKIPVFTYFRIPSQSNRFSRTGLEKSFFGL